LPFTRQDPRKHSTAGEMPRRNAFIFPNESRPTDCLRSSLWNSPLQLEPPPHTPVPDIHWIAKHERATSHNAFHSKEPGLADSIFRNTALPKGTMKPYSRYAAFLALANDRWGDSRMGGNHCHRISHLQQYLFCCCYIWLRCDHDHAECDRVLFAISDT